jgi:hypothetical protein
MKRIILFTLTLIMAINLSAQIDTTLKEFWPLGLGDTWQFRNQHGEISTYIQVIAVDTLLPNGYRYAKIGVPPNFNTGFSYDRIDSLFRVQWGGPCDTCTQIIDSCGGTAPTEISIYRLGDTVGTIWRDCINWNGFLGPPLIRYDGIHLLPAFGELRETMVFQFGFYNSDINDTIFTVQDLVVRGIGLFRRAYWEAGEYEILTGAIINGVSYGTIVSVNGLAENIPEKIILHQNYPNPFNPTTKIRYEISKITNVKLKVINIIGEELAILVNEVKYPGIYEIELDGKNLSSRCLHCCFTNK